MRRAARRNPRLIALALAILSATFGPGGATAGPFDGLKRVVFLGDSITYSGQFIEDIEAYLRLKSPGLSCEFLDLGLPSETVSGLSEPGHAGGAFPRPTLHERLGRVLEKTKPDLLIACYGMNDGIYYPFGEDRFKAYQDGIRRLREQALASGAKVLHVTPPPFDAVPIKSQTLPAGLAEYRKPFEGYDEVLTRYAEWLKGRKAEGWEVVDIHTPLRETIDASRKRDPRFRLADDGVHLNELGHWLIAKAFLRHWNVLDPEDEKAESAAAVFASKPSGTEVLKWVVFRQRIMKDAWLTATGHKRPGMAKGMPLEEAVRRAAAINEQIRTHLGSGIQVGK